MPDNNKKIYIVLSQTNTLISKLIHVFSTERYAHSSIAFDIMLKDMYSFGRKSLWNYLNAGFLKETVDTGVFWLHRDEALCKVMELEVTAEQYENALKEVAKFADTDKDVHYGYNFTGLLAAGFGYPLKRKKSFFCSQFVAYIIKQSGIANFDIPWELVRPHDIQALPGMKFIYEGLLSDYPAAMRKALGLPEPVITHQKNRSFYETVFYIASRKLF